MSRLHSSIGAKYFPVRPEPLRMVAGLQPLGHDFGNGVADTRCFQLDGARPVYLTAKQQVPLARHWCDESQPQLQAKALDWLGRTMDHEGLAVRHPSSTASWSEQWWTYASQVQEDLVLFQRGEGLGRAAALWVCFPSGWRPERLRGASFAAIHAPVPDFSDPKLARAMTSAMLDRGPQVRFVWTISADAHLDHHPEQGCRVPFTPDTREAWLRVERQVSVPLRSGDAALFLIRTYLYPLAGLQEAERRTLAQALERMPADIQRYKGLVSAIPVVRQLLS